MTKFEIRVPASSANLGPGFDTLGLALSLYLELTVRIPNPREATFTIICEGEGSDNLSTSYESNLITKTAAKFARKNGSELPRSILVHCRNNIPLGSGLGSSGAAIVAGVLLANRACGLNLSASTMLDFCADEEGHPDNVGPSLLGGLVAAFMDQRNNQNQQINELDHITRSVSIPISQMIKVVAVTPKFHLATSQARQVLPSEYQMKDLVYNIQKTAVLTHALSSVSHDIKSRELVYHAMKDKVHQEYRMHLVPGMREVFESLRIDNCPGLVGVCLSGAGPTIVALAVDNYEDIGRRIKNILDEHKENQNVSVRVQILEVDRTGATCE